MPTIQQVWDLHASSTGHALDPGMELFLLAKDNSSINTLTTQVPSLKEAARYSVIKLTPLANYSA